MTEIEVPVWEIEDWAAEYEKLEAVNAKLLTALDNREITPSVRRTCGVWTCV